MTTECVKLYLTDQVARIENRLEGYSEILPYSSKPKNLIKEMLKLIATIDNEELRNFYYDHYKIGENYK